MNTRATDDTTLVVDIGNTSTSLARAEGDQLLDVQRVPSDDPALTLHSVPARAIIASVKPEVNGRWEGLLRDRGIADILWVDHTVNLGIPVSYPKPETIGADRLANACEAAARYGVPSVVCDFGTALTFDILRHPEGYVGGIICPGLPLMFDYLAEKTALLPHVKPSPATGIIGRSTVEAMQIGAHWGYLGMVREIVGRLREELGAEVPVCATGGHAAWVFEGWDGAIPVDPHLTLKGLARIGHLNPIG